MIRHISVSDTQSIADIYNYYILNSTVTFEEEKVTIDEIAERIKEVQSADLPWLIAENDSEILGYAFAKKWKERSAYRFAVEISVYVKHTEHGKGWGSLLYEALFDELADTDIHTAIGGITLPNEASVGLHEKFGMKKVAHFHEIGYKFGEWRDVGYWEKNIA